jgi:serine/threonine-protein kinase
VRVLSALQHPNILRLLDSGDIDGHLFYVTPYEEGESLRELIARTGALPLPQVLQLGIEIADALAHAHAHGIVHRDVKPENVLIEAGHAVLADFGIAVAGDEAADRLTATGISVGTPAYMSPEQAAAESRIDARSDVYSAGCVLYEMLTGDVPFTGATTQGVIARRLSTDPAPPHVLRAAVPPALDRLVMTALARNPADRYQDAAALRDAIEAARSEPAAAPPAGPPPAAAWRRPLLRRRQYVLVSAAAAGVLLWWLARPHGGRDALDANLVAVAPFEVLDPELALWRQGFVDVLASNLDGAGSLRTVAPTAVLRDWDGHPDRASATAIARNTGAGIAVFGRLERAGDDSVRCTAWIDDARSGDRLGELVLREAAGRMDRLGDSLSIGILRELGRGRVVGAARIGSLGSRSLPAIKAFLQGEQFLRRSSLDSARQAYERAVALDSTFGRAMNRLGVVLGWIGTAYGEEGNRLIWTAARHATGLAPRDSLQLVSDALYAKLMLTERDTAWWTESRMLLANLRDLSTRSPSDPVVWNALGEAFFHLDGALGVSWDDARAAFDRSIALDSAFAPAWVHPISIALSRGDTASARRYARGQRNLQSAGARHAWSALVDDVLSSALPSSSDVDRRLSQLAAADAFEVWAATAGWPDSAQLAIRAARAMTRAARSGNPSFDDPAFARGFLTMALLDRGHFREAVKTGPAEAEEALPFLALIGAIPAESARGVFDGWVRGGRGNAHSILPWWATRGDTAAIRAFDQRAQSRSRSSSPDERRLGAFETRAAAAFLALARGDSARASTLLLNLPDSLCPRCFVHRFTLAHLLLATGRTATADTLLRRDLTDLASRRSPADVLWRLARARAAQAVGARDRAITWYDNVWRSFRYGDPEAQAIAAEAQRRLAELTREPDSPRDRAAPGRGPG